MWYVVKLLLFLFWCVGVIVCRICNFWFWCFLMLFVVVGCSIVFWFFCVRCKFVFCLCCGWWWCFWRIMLVKVFDLYVGWLLCRCWWFFCNWFCRCFCSILGCCWLYMVLGSRFVWFCFFCGFWFLIWLGELMMLNGWCRKLIWLVVLFVGFGCRCCVFVLIFWVDVSCFVLGCGCWCWWIVGVFFGFLVFKFGWCICWRIFWMCIWIVWNFWSVCCVWLWCGWMFVMCDIVLYRSRCWWSWCFCWICRRCVFGLGSCVGLFVLVWLCGSCCCFVWLRVLIWYGFGCLLWLMCGLLFWLFVWSLVSLLFWWCLVILGCMKCFCLFWYMISFCWIMMV